MTRRTDVLVVGAGPAGLSAARALASSGRCQVLVLEREKAPGGIPRHSDHHGFGLRDLRRPLRGPAYARQLTDLAVDAGVTVETGAMVTGWDGQHAVDVTSPAGRRRIEAEAIVLATGARERSRAARGIAGDRPAGVLTTGQLQQEVHLRGRPVGTRAVVVGSELVSWSAVLTLRSVGCRVVRMVTAAASPESYTSWHLVGRVGLRVPVATRTRVTRVLGHGRVEAVELEHMGTGRRETVACDTLVCTGDWIPDHELVRTGGVEVDAGTRGPLVDTALRTSRSGVFAAGNLVHPVDTADVAALDGRHLAGPVLAWLDGSLPAPHAVRLTAEAPFAWVAPGLVRDGDPAPARGRLLLWPAERMGRPTVVVRQGTGVVARWCSPWPAAPGRVFRVPARVLDAVVRRGEPVTVGAG